MLTADEITRMRETIDSALPDLVSVQAKTRTPDSRGGAKLGWITLVTVPGRVSPIKERDQEVEVAGSVQAQADWIVTLPHGTAVHESNRLVVSLGGAAEDEALALRGAGGSALRAGVVVETADELLEVTRVEEGRSWSLGVRVRCREMT